MTDLSKMTPEEKAALLAALNADAQDAASGDFAASKQVYLDTVEKAKEAKAAYEAAICKLKGVTYNENEFNITKVFPTIADDQPELDLIMVSLSVFVANESNRKGRFDITLPIPQIEELK